MTIPGWVLAIFLAMAASVPVGIFFTATLYVPPDQSYTYVGEGTYSGVQDLYSELGFLEF